MSQAPIFDDLPGVRRYMKRARANSVVKGTLAGSENKLPKLSKITKDLYTLNKEK
jgi:hypothetical protein